MIRSLKPAEPLSSSSSPKQVSRHILVFLVLLGLVGIGLVTLAVRETQVALRSAVSRQFVAASQHAQNSSQITRVLSTVTFRRLVVIEVWHEGVQTLHEVAQVPDLVQQYVKSSFQNETDTSHRAQSLISQVSNVALHSQKLNLLLKKTPLLQKWIDAQLLHRGVLMSSSEVVQMVQDFNILSTHFLQGDHKYLILLQNSEELRATGGFIGSYVVVELHDGKLQELKIRDIYDADGQFQGYVEAPPGLSEYLSSGNGMRLPDANWNPDFPSSAQEMLKFFSQSKETEVDGLVALNLSVMQKIIEELGPLYLPDYQQTVTADNLPLVARADRSEFFAGSQQKKNFLQALLTQLKIRVQELPVDQQLRLIKLLTKQTQEKNIQVFSHASNIQEVFQKYQVAGEMKTIDSAFSLFIVESNVGINKVNHQVSRQVEFDVDDQSATVRVQFVNYNDSTQPTAKFFNRSDKNLHYINYVRVFLPSDVEVQTISLNDQVIDKKDERIITAANGQQFKEVGFLAPVPEKTEAHVFMALHLPERFAQLDKVFIQKQSGLPPTSYALQINEKLSSFTLEKDTLVQFPL